MVECLLCWSFIANQSSNVSPEHCVTQDSRLVHVEHNDRDFVVHAETEGRRIHDLETLRERFGERETIVATRVRKLVWVTIINAVDLRGFQDHVRSNLTCAQRCRRVGRKIRVTGAGGENYNPAQLQMPNSAAEDEWLGHIIHLDRSLDAGLDADLLECAS